MSIQLKSTEIVDAVQFDGTNFAETVSFMGAVAADTQITLFVQTSSGLIKIPEDHWVFKTAENAFYAISDADKQVNYSPTSP